MTNSNEPIIDQRDIFISHRSADDVWAKALAERLELSSCRVWIDDLDIAPGQSIPGAINHGLQISRFVGLVMTPAYFAVNSDWTSAEWHAALFSDPDGRGTRVLPLYVQNCPDVPPLLKHLRWMDFRDANNYKQAFDELLRVLEGKASRFPTWSAGQQITRSGTISQATLLVERSSVDGKPDDINEELGSNLLPVIGLPKTITSAPISRALAKPTSRGSSFPTKRQLASVIQQWLVSVQLKPFTPVFLRQEDSIWTVYDLTSKRFPLTPIIEKSGYVRMEVQDLLRNPATRRLAIELLMMCVHRHCYRVGLVETHNHRFIYSSTNGEDVKKQWKLKVAAERTVTKRYINEVNGMVFYYHEAAFIDTIFLNDGLFLRVQPTVAFSDDGTDQTIWRGPRVGPMAMKWLAKQKNIDVFRDIRFWFYQLSEGKSAIRMYAGNQELKFDTRPASVQITGGIAGDHANIEEFMDRLPALPTEHDLRFGATPNFEDDDDEL